MYHDRQALSGECVTPAQKQKLIHGLVDRWQVPMGLGGWMLRLFFPKRIKHIASCMAQPEYLTADLEFNLKRVPDTAMEIEELVAHELMHCHVEALGILALRGARRSPERREAVRLAEEHLTTTLSRLLLPWLRTQ